MNFSAKVGTFLWYCKKNNIPGACECIENGEDILNTHWNKNGLMFACIKGHSDLVKKLLTYPRVRDIINHAESHDTPLISACRSGCVDIFDMLVETGADSNLPSLDGTTCLMVACEYNRLNIIDKLLSLRANVNSLNTNRIAAIFYCTSVAAIHRLYIYGANLDIAGNSGTTPLSYFISSDKDAIVAALIDCGANPNLVYNSDCNSPLIIATRCNNSYIVELLLNVHADKNYVNNKGYTALNYAINNNNQQIITLLTT